MASGATWMLQRGSVSQFGKLMRRVFRPSLVIPMAATRIALPELSPRISRFFPFLNLSPKILNLASDRGKVNEAQTGDPSTGVDCASSVILSERAPFSSPLPLYHSGGSWFRIIRKIQRTSRKSTSTSNGTMA